jgi:hypothetical protein
MSGLPSARSANKSHQDARLATAALEVTYFSGGNLFSLHAVEAPIFYPDNIHYKDETNDNRVANPCSGMPEQKSRAINVPAKVMPSGPTLFSVNRK